MAMAPRFEDLRRMSEQELVELYDRVAENVQVSLGFIRQELASREADRQTAAIVRLTKQIALLTVVIAVLTAASTAFVIYSVVHADDTNSPTKPPTASTTTTSGP